MILSNRLPDGREERYLAYQRKEEFYNEINYTTS